MYSCSAGLQGSVISEHTTYAEKMADARIGFNLDDNPIFSLVL